MSGAKPAWDDDRISAYVDDVLDADERRRFERELDARPELRAAIEQMRRMREALQSLPKHQLPLDFAERVLRTAEQRMLLGAEVRPAPAMERQAPARRLRWLLVPLAAAAAILLITLLRPHDADRRVAQAPTVSAPSTTDSSGALAPPDRNAAELAMTDDAELAELAQAHPESAAESMGTGGGVEELAAMATDPDAEPSLIPSEITMRCDRVVVAVPRTQNRQLYLEGALSKSKMLAKDEAARSGRQPSIGDAGVQRRAGRTGDDFRQAERAEANERRRNDAEQRNDLASVLYDVFLVSAPSPEPLDRFLEQLNAEEMEIEAKFVGAPTEARLLDVLQQVPRQVPADVGEATPSHTLDDFLGKQIPLSTEDGQPSVTVTALGQVRAAAHSVEEIVSQLERIPRHSRSTTDLGAPGSQASGGKAHSGEQTPPLPCSMLLIVESVPPED